MVTGIDNININWDDIDVHGKLKEKCLEIAEFLIQKNIKYGNSALNPLRVFSRSNPLEQIDVRLDDKLSRIMRGEGENEDPELDIAGYLILKMVCLDVYRDEYEKLPDFDPQTNTYKNKDAALRASLKLEVPEKKDE